MMSMKRSALCNRQQLCCYSFPTIVEMAHSSEVTALGPCLERRDHWPSDVIPSSPRVTAVDSQGPGL